MQRSSTVATVKDPDYGSSGAVHWLQEVGECCWHSSSGVLVF